MIFQEISQKISDLWELKSKYLDRSRVAAISYVKIIAFLSILTVNSCNDIGCIEADDFGEYQTKTLVIESRNNTDSCEFDYNNREDVESETHGSGLNDCLTRGNVTVIDENQDRHMSSTGCSHWQARQSLGSLGNRSPNPNVNLNLLNQCVERCVARCNEVVMSGSSSNIEPNWKSTEFPGGGEVMLAPGTQISVRAVGNVTTGGEQNLTELYAIANESSFMPTAKNANGDDLFLSITTGDSVGLKFGGGFFDGDTSLSSTRIGDVGLMNLQGNNLSLETHFASNPSDRADLINASRRLALYIEPFPRGFYYNSSSGARGEVFSTNNVTGSTIRPDHRFWACQYDASGDLYELSCANDIEAYMLNYPSLSMGGDILKVGSNINGNFPISSDIAAAGLSVNGGILKTTAQNQTYQDESAYDPFSTANCPAQYGCSVNALDGVIVGDLSTARSKAISRTSQIYFKYLQSSCSGDIDVAIKASDQSTTDLYTYNSVTVDNSGWTSGGSFIIGENNQYIEIQRSALNANSNNPPQATTFVNSSGSQVDCGESLAIKFVPVFDFEVNKSGLVSFANLGGVTSSGACNIRFRIINPTGSHDTQNIPSDIINAYNTGNLTTLDPDFYEYGDFNGLNPTPEDSSGLRTVDSNWNSDMLGKIYVRKGQKIRFAPESWSGTWNPNVGMQRKCGVGMALRIEPRPALLCRGKGSQRVRNPSCTQRLVNGEVRGCETIAPVCSDANGNSFCPDTTNCVGSITFTEPTDSISPRVGGVITQITAANLLTNMATHNCASVYNLETNPPTGAIPSRIGVNFTALQNCYNCQNAMRDAGLQSPVVQLPDVQYCYNLEEYKGKVENIVGNFNNFFTTVPAPDITHLSVTKGLAPLQMFNGGLGNVGDVGDVYNDYLVKTRSSVSFNREGALKLMILDGEDFKPQTIVNSYNNNGVASSGGVAYSSSHNNGFRVKLNKFLEFSNGENLEVLFCKESSEFSNDCGGSLRWDGSTVFATDPPPNIIDFTKTDNSFAFDRYGDLYRNVEPRSGEDNCDNVTAGNKYFCHCRGGDFQADNIEGCGAPAMNDFDSHCGDVAGCRYRLTFKINDPESGNCIIPTSTDPISGVCDNIENNSIVDCNGIKSFNSGYVVEDPNNASSTPTTGLICNYTELYPTNASGDILPSTCVKQFVCASKYANNTGKYNVLVRVKIKRNEISGLVSSIIDPVLEVMDGTGSVGDVDRVPGQAERIYKLIVSDPSYQLILKMSLVLMVSFYGLTYLMGLNDGGTSDIIARVVKISLILFFVSDQGWEVFNRFVVATFKDATDEISFMMATSFDDSDALRTAIANKEYGDKSVLFSSIDKVMGLFFASAVQKKISALLFAGLFGWLYLLFIYYAFISYIFAVSTAVLIYLTAQVFISVLFVLGPIFFIFTLFSQTKEMFDKWLQQLIGFSLQQIFLLVTLSFFNMMMYEIIKNSLGYKVCWDEVWTINILITVSLMSFWTIPNIPKLFDSQAEPGSSGSGEGVPSLFSILFIWIVAKLMLEFVTFMSDVAADIGGGIKTSALSSGIAKSVGDVRKKVSSEAKKLYNDKIGFSATDYLDNKLFDSGKTAKKKREQKRAQDKADLSNKGAMVKSGREAVHDYKKNNGADLAKLSAAEQQKKLNEVRDSAMSEKGKQLGLNEEQIDKLKNQKGVAYRGDNLAGYIAKTVYQKAKTGGSVTKSITHEDVKLELTKSEAKKSLERTDQEKRGEMMSAIEKGGVYVKSGRWARKTSDPVKGLGIKESKAHKHARQQLESEGKINKYLALGRLVRSNDESKLIRDRIKENKFVDGDIDKTSRISTIAHLQEKVNKMNQKELKKSGEDIPDEMKQSRKEIKQNLRDNRFKTAIEALGGKDGKGGKIAEFDKAMEKQRDIILKADDAIKKLKREPQTPENITKIEDQIAIKNRANNAIDDNSDAKKRVKSNIASLKNIEEIEKGVDIVLADKGSYRKDVVNKAKEAKKDIEKFKKRDLGVKEGGYSKLGVAAAIVGMTPIASVVKAISGGDREDSTRSGILGARRRSTDESMAYLDQKHGVLADISNKANGKNNNTNPSVGVGDDDSPPPPPPPPSSTLPPPPLPLGGASTMETITEDEEVEGTGGGGVAGIVNDPSRGRASRSSRSGPVGDNPASGGEGDPLDNMESISEDAEEGVAGGAPSAPGSGGRVTSSVVGSGSGDRATISNVASSGPRPAVRPGSVGDNPASGDEGDPLDNMESISEDTEEEGVGGAPSDLGAGGRVTSSVVGSGSGDRATISSGASSGSRGLRPPVRPGPVGGNPDSGGEGDNTVSPDPDYKEDGDQ